MNHSVKDSTLRFSKTVDYYDCYRPSYPTQVITTLFKECNLNGAKIIADIGSGTGIFTKQLLMHGNPVYGVEPNQDMRRAAEQLLSSYSNFKSVNGTAEATNLLNQSVDLITVAQAFHWLDPVKTKDEFKRILKSQGWVALIWNIKIFTASPIMQGYENLLQNYGIDYKKVELAQNVTKESIEQFFYPAKVQYKNFPNIQVLDWDGFKGRLLSASYTPKPNDAGYDAMLAAAKQAFDRCQKNGKIEFIYETKLYYGAF